MRKKTFYTRILKLYLDPTDEYKLDYICKKTGLKEGKLLKALICMMFHDVEPPFREYND